MAAAIGLLSGARDLLKEIDSNVPDHDDVAATEYVGRRRGVRLELDRSGRAPLIGFLNRPRAVQRLLKLSWPS